MSVHDALGQYKAGKSPCVGMGSEEVVVDLLAPLGAPLEILASVPAIPPPSRVRRKPGPKRWDGPRSFARPWVRLPDDVRDAAQARIAAGEPIPLVAADLGISKGGAYYIARSIGLGRDPERVALVAAILDAYSAQVAPIGYIQASGRDKRAMPYRIADDARVKVYAPKSAAHSRPNLGPLYYHPQTHSSSLCLVCLPDGEAFAFEPVPFGGRRSYFIQADPEHRGIWRERATAFQVQP